MSNANALAVSGGAPGAITQTTSGITPEQERIIWDIYCKGASPDEARVFLEICKARSLSPLHKQIFPVKRWDSKLGKEVLEPQVSLDGLRSKAFETGEYHGMEGPWWCGSDGAWVDVWLSPNPPVAAKVVIHRKGYMPRTAIALYESQVQKTKAGAPNQFWAKMPAHMLAKCAEAQAIRALFPHTTSGLYLREEMIDDSVVDVTPAPPSGARRGRPPKIDTPAAPQPQATPQAPVTSEPTPEPTPEPTSEISDKQFYATAQRLGYSKEAYKVALISLGYSGGTATIPQNQRIAVLEELQKRMESQGLDTVIAAESMAEMFDGQVIPPPPQDLEDSEGQEEYDDEEDEEDGGDGESYDEFLTTNGN